MNHLYKLTAGLCALIVLLILGILWANGNVREDIKLLKSSIDLKMTGIADDVKHGPMNYFIAESESWRLKPFPCPPGYACAYSPHKNNDKNGTQWLKGIRCENGGAKKSLEEEFMNEMRGDQ